MCDTRGQSGGRPRDYPFAIAAPRNALSHARFSHQTSTHERSMEGRGLDETQGGGATVLSIAQGLGLEFVPMSALHFLDGPDIARCGVANRFLYSAACNEGVWQAARDRLWEGKVFIPGSSRSLRAKEGYLASLQDSKRTWLLMEELISFSWWFRFKQQAGEAWTAQDPWYRNEKVNHR